MKTISHKTTYGTLLLIASTVFFVGCNGQKSPNKTTATKPSSGTFWEAVQNDDWSLMRRWIEYDPSLVNSRGVYIDYAYAPFGTKPKNPPERLGMTPLILATMRRNRDMVTFFCENGADLNQKDENGLAALHVAALKSKGNDHVFTDIVKILLDRGADVNVETSPEKLTPLNFTNPDNPNSSEAERDIARILSTAGGRKVEVKEGIIFFY